MTPETKARIQIDRKLTESGYVVQDFAEFNPAASLGVVVREYPTSSGSRFAYLPFASFFLHQANNSSDISQKSTLPPFLRYTKVSIIAFSFDAAKNCSSFCCLT